ncbi:MAG TPA: hypothetical protein V6C88_13295 [Chroococcidiopsis sp.]
MIDSSHPISPVSSELVPVFLQKLVKRCHITLPDSHDPIGAVAYDGGYYAYVRFFPSLETAQRGAQRLIEKGRKVVLTRVPKGLVLWVHEPDACLVDRATVP